MRKKFTTFKISLLIFILFVSPVAFVLPNIQVFKNHFNPVSQELIIVNVSTRDQVVNTAIGEITSRFSTIDITIIDISDIAELLIVFKKYSNTPMIILGHGNNYGIGTSKQVMISWNELSNIDFSIREKPVLLFACGTNNIDNIAKKEVLNNPGFVTPNVEFLDVRTITLFLYSYLTNYTNYRLSDLNLIEIIIKTYKYLSNPNPEISLHILDPGGSGGGSGGGPPNNPPSEPRNLAANTNANGLILTWNAPVSTSGASVTYDIYYSSSSSGSYSLLGTTGSTSMQVNLDINSEYYYKVRAKTQYGTSSFTSSVLGKTFHYNSYPLGMSSFLGDYSGDNEYWHNWLTFFILLMGSIMPLTAALIGSTVVIAIILVLAAGAIWLEFISMVDSWLPVLVNLFTTGSTGLSLAGLIDLLFHTIVIIIHIIVFWVELSVISSLAPAVALGEQAAHVATGGITLAAAITVALISSIYVISNIIDDTHDYDDTIDWSFFF